MKRLHADFLLLIAAFIWGTTFVFQKEAAPLVPPVFFVGFRFFLSAVALMPLALREMRRQAAFKPHDLILAGLVGLCLFAATTLQQAGMSTTTATNGGFLTAVYVALVPFASRFILGTKLRPYLLLACGVSLLGAWLLATDGRAFNWAKGDILVLASAVAWALHITLVGKFLSRHNRPFLLSFIQYLVTGALGLAGGWAFEPVTAGGVNQAMFYILFAGLGSGAVAFTLQIIGQRAAPSSEAALIMSMESVFAALAGAVLLHEQLTTLGTAGCALILLGVVMAEASPFWRRRAPPPQT